MARLSSVSNYYYIINISCNIAKKITYKGDFEFITCRIGFESSLITFNVELVPSLQIGDRKILELQNIEQSHYDKIYSHKL